MTSQQARVPMASEPEALAKLTETFDSFNRMSNELAHAWEGLRERTARLDLALNDANLRLNEKVIELDELNSNLDAILDSIPSAAVVTDTDRRVTRVNRAAEAILGVKRDRLVGRNAAEIVDHRGYPVLHLCQSTTTGSNVPSREIVLDDGRQRVITSCVSKVVDAGGHRLGYVEIVTDITEIEALRVRLHRLDTLAALGEMAAAIAHELRNPLTAVEGYAGLMRRAVNRGVESSSLIDHVKKIEIGAHEASSIIQRILTFASPGVMARDTVAIEEVVRAAVADRAALAVEVVTPDHPLKVKGDHLLLRQAIRNLIDNACSFCSEQDVTITLEGKEQLLTMTVADRGPGIPDAIRDRLFMPFVTARRGGTGLGLAIVHRIIDLHGGTVRAEDNPGGGACFVIQMPAHCAGKNSEGGS